MLFLTLIISFFCQLRWYTRVRSGRGTGCQHGARRGASGPAARGASGFHHPEGGDDDQVRPLLFRKNDRYFCVGFLRVVPDIRPFLISVIWPDIRFHLPDIRLAV